MCIYVYVYKCIFKRRTRPVASRLSIIPSDNTACTRRILVYEKQPPPLGPT